MNGDEPTTTRSASGSPSAAPIVEPAEHDSPERQHLDLRWNPIRSCLPIDTPTPRKGRAGTRDRADIRLTEIERGQRQRAGRRTRADPGERRRGSGRGRGDGPARDQSTGTRAPETFRYQEPAYPMSDIGLAGGSAPSTPGRRHGATPRRFWASPASEAHGRPPPSTRWRGSSACAPALRVTAATDRAGSLLRASRKRLARHSRRTKHRSVVAVLRTSAAVPLPCSTTATRCRGPATSRTPTGSAGRTRRAARGRGERSVPSPAPMYAHWVGWLMLPNGVKSQPFVFPSFARPSLSTARIAYVARAEHLMSRGSACWVRPVAGW